MSESKAAWDEVGERFAELGRRIKDRYDAQAAFGEERAKVDDALKNLADALDTTFTTIGETIRDPEIRDELRETASAMGNAFATTFHEVGDEISKIFEKRS
jgi:hypothetical protein